MEHHNFSCHPNNFRAGYMVKGNKFFVKVGDRSFRVGIQKLTEALKGATRINGSVKTTEPFDVDVYITSIYEERHPHQ